MLRIGCGQRVDSSPRADEKAGSCSIGQAGRSVFRATHSIEAAPFLPADRRVADDRAEATPPPHAQPSTANEATADAWASAGFLLGYGFRCQYG